MRWSAYGHEIDGGPMSRGFLERIGIKNAIVDQVVRLVENHMVASGVGRDPTPRAVRRLAMRLAPASIAQLMRLIEADASGRPPLPPGLPEGAARIQAMAQAQSVAQGPQAPLILGRHVLPYFEDGPGKHIGEVTHAAYEAQADGEFSGEAECFSFKSCRSIFFLLQYIENVPCFKIRTNTAARRLEHFVDVGNHMHPEFFPQLFEFVGEYLQPIRLEKLLSRDSTYNEQFPSSLPNVAKAYLEDLDKEYPVPANKKKPLTKALFPWIRMIMESNEQ